MGIVKIPESREAAPPGHELAGLAPERRQQLEKLQAAVEGTATADGDPVEDINKAKKQLELAIETGNRRQVRVALDNLRQYTKFGSLRKDIDELHREMGDWTDAPVAAAEETTSTLMTKHVPGWAKIPLVGMAAGGIMIGMSYPLSWLERGWRKLFGMNKKAEEHDHKGDGEHDTKHAPAGPRLPMANGLASFGKLLMAAGAVGGVAKGVYDVVQEKGNFGALLPASMRDNVPNPQFAERAKALLESRVVVTPKDIAGVKKNIITIPGVDATATRIVGIKMTLKPDKNSVIKSIEKVGGGAGDNNLATSSDFDGEDYESVEVQFKMDGGAYSDANKVTKPLPKLK